MQRRRVEADDEDAAQEAGEECEGGLDEDAGGAKGQECVSEEEEQDLSGQGAGV
ncbi:MAG: hypothetical protein ACPIOQ_83560 [Promethearchaeia archaeon]